jgi:hypothetical protein
MTTLFDIAEADGRRITAEVYQGLKWSDSY